MLPTQLLRVTKTLPLFVVIALVLLPLRLAMAQTPSVSANVDGYTAIGTGATIPQSEWVPITVTRNDSLLHAEASGDGGSFSTRCTIPCRYSPAFTSTSAAGFASADPGVLHIFGSDLVVALPELNAPNVPVSPNNDTVVANISVGAAFTDYLTVGFPGQPIGTPVQVPFRYAAEVVSDTILGYPQYSLHPIGVSVSFRFTGFGDQNFSTENFYGFSHTTLANGNYLHSVRSNEFLINAHVGDVLTISATFGIFGTPRIVNDNSYTLGAWADGRNTAGIWLGNLPSGMVITSASGHDYRIDPTAAVTPVAPIQVTATATPADGRAIVSFNSPNGSGAAAITGYTVTSIPDGKTATGTRSPIVVMGLANGTAYTFTVTAKNAAAMSTTSMPTNSVTPTALLAVSVPSSPVIGVATAGDAQATVNFSVPNDGGSAITGYTVTSFPSGIAATGAASPIVVAGLTNGAAYTFTVTASNALGTSASSAASNSVTPLAAATVAAAPSIGIAVASDKQATVNFTAPANDGGSAVTSYAVTSSPGGITATGSASPIVITGLTNGTAYTFTVTAVNAVGASALSAASNSVTPASAIVPSPTPASTSAPATGGGGGSISMLLLLSLSVTVALRRRLFGEKGVRQC
jgi:invasion protein IalB